MEAVSGESRWKLKTPKKRYATDENQRRCTHFTFVFFHFSHFLSLFRKSNTLESHFAEVPFEISFSDLITPIISFNYPNCPNYRAKMAMAIPKSGLSRFMKEGAQVLKIDFLQKFVILYQSIATFTKIVQFIARKALISKYYLLPFYQSLPFPGLQRSGWGCAEEHRCGRRIGRPIASGLWTKW